MMNTINEHTAPLFSVVVPAYNSAKFISKCVDSVLGQTYSDFELLLIDDGSTDETLSVCTSYAERDSRVRVLHKENGGHTSARNEGLTASLGKYLLFLDSDDWFSPDVLLRCRDEIVESSADIIVFSLVNTLTNRAFDVNIDIGRYSARDNRIINALLMDPSGRSLFPKSLSGKAFRREVIFKNQLGVPREVRVAEDGMAFVGAVLDSTVISVISGPSYYCLIRSGSVSRSSDRKAFERLPYLIAFYREKLSGRADVLGEQFDRYTVAQLYTAALFVMRSGEGRKELNEGLSSVLSDPSVKESLKNAKFSREGRRLRVKKMILRYRLWWLAKLLDR